MSLIVNPALVAADLRTIFGAPDYRTFADALNFGLLYNVRETTLAAARRADAAGAPEFCWRHNGRTRWAHKDATGLVQMGRRKVKP